jgi:hypothetical protein
MELEKILDHKKSLTTDFVDPYIKDIDNPVWKIDLGLALENEKLFVEQVWTKPEDDKYKDKYKAEMVPTVFEIFSNLHSSKFVSIQTLAGPNGPIYYPNNEGDLITEDVFSKTRILKLKVKDIDPVAHGKIIAEEIDREIFADLCNNAGQRLIWDISAVEGDTLSEKCKDLVAVIKRTRQAIKAQSKREEANWCVTSPTGCNLLEMGGMQAEINNWGAIKNICQVGQLLDMKVYCDPLFKPTMFLLGYRGLNPYDSGYFYCPYIMLSILGPSEGTEERQMIIRYGKKLKKLGSNYYAKIEIDEETWYKF